MSLLKTNLVGISLFHVESVNGYRTIKWFVCMQVEWTLLLSRTFLPLLQSLSFVIVNGFRVYSTYALVAFQILKLKRVAVA